MKNLYVLTLTTLFALTACSSDSPSGNSNAILVAEKPSQPATETSSTSTVSTGFTAPDLSKKVAISAKDALLFEDAASPGYYWYLPLVISPTKMNDGTYSRPVVRADYFYFSFYGRRMLSEKTIKELVHRRGIPEDRLAEVSLNSHDGIVCPSLNELGVKHETTGTLPLEREIFSLVIYTRDPVKVRALDEAVQISGNIECVSTIAFVGRKDGLITTAKEEVRIQIYVPY